MGKSKRQRLIELGPAILADVLLDLASHDVAVANAVGQAIATSAPAVLPTQGVDQEEHVHLFKRNLANIRRRTRGYDWDEAFEFARDLEALLRNLAFNVQDPAQGMMLVASFFEADGDIFSLCDDSLGFVGEVFRRDATDLFVRYASECADQAWAQGLLWSSILTMSTARVRSLCATQAGVSVSRVPGR